MTGFFNNLFITCDAPRPWGLYFQDSASPQMEALVELHDNIMFYLVIILFGVAWILISVVGNYVYNKSPISNKYLNHGTLIELIWTITPALILILIALPSFKLLYLMDEVTDPSLTVFVEGHQWYWSYQYPDFISDDSVFLSSSESSNSSSESSSDSDESNPPVDPNDLEDSERPDPHSEIALCDHVDRYYYDLSLDGPEEQEAINNTMCSIAGENDRIPDTERTVPHNAFPEDYQGGDDPRRPLYCPDCHAIICHVCNNPSHSSSPSQ